MRTGWSLLLLLHLPPAQRLQLAQGMLSLAKPLDHVLRNSYQVSGEYVSLPFESPSMQGLGRAAREAALAWCAGGGPDGPQALLSSLVEETRAHFPHLRLSWHSCQSHVVLVPGLFE